jgi:hypothetical protein
MNELNISLGEFEKQRNLKKVRPLYPSYCDYEERKRELSSRSLCNREYEIASRRLVDELGL